jgi:hypothetical protein
MFYGVVVLPPSTECLVCLRVTFYATEREVACAEYLENASGVCIRE